MNYIHCEDESKIESKKEEVRKKVRKSVCAA